MLEGEPPLEEASSRSLDRSQHLGLAVAEEGLAVALGLDDWLGMGMALAIGGERVERGAVLEHGVELALLPPVSGG